MQAHVLLKIFHSTLILPPRCRHRPLNRGLATFKVLMPLLVPSLDKICIDFSSLILMCPKSLLQELRLFELRGHITFEHLAAFSTFVVIRCRHTGLVYRKDNLSLVI